MALNDVPLSGQTLQITRAPIRDNFSTVDTAFQVDHVDYNLPNQGWHDQATFPVQNPTPAPTAAVVRLFAATSSFTSQPELFLQHQAGSTAPLAAQVNEFSSAGWADPGWAVLPSGIKLKWHSNIGFGASTNYIVDINTDVPGSPNWTAILNIQITTMDSAASYNNVIGIQSITFPTFTVACFNGAVPPGTVSFGYLAIGY